MKILFTTSMLYGAMGCQWEWGNDIEYIYYNLQNESGHTVTIVQKPACNLLPNPLILLDKGVYSFYYGQTINKRGLDFFDDTNFESRTVCYDDRYRISFDDLPEERMPQNLTVYDEDNLGQMVFTFTEADYEYAVEHGTDLSIKTTNHRF